MLPNGATAGRPEDALDTACGLYLSDPTAWINPPKDWQLKALARARGSPLGPAPAPILELDTGCEPGCVLRGGCRKSIVLSSLM